MDRQYRTLAFNRKKIAILALAFQVTFGVLCMWMQHPNAPTLTQTVSTATIQEHPYLGLQEQLTCGLETQEITIQTETQTLPLSAGSSFAILITNPFSMAETQFSSEPHQENPIVTLTPSIPKHHERPPKIG